MRHDGSSVQIHPAERFASLVLGGGLITLGMRGSILQRASSTLAGGTLVYHGLSGGSTSPAFQAHTTRAITIGASPERLHAMWRDPEVLSRIIASPLCVEPAADAGLRWTTCDIPALAISWTTHYIEDRPGDILRWVSDTQVPMHMEGVLRFKAAPPDWGTEVYLETTFRSNVPGLAKLSKPLQELFADKALRRLKNLAETNEIATLRKNPAARDSGRAS